MTIIDFGELGNAIVACEQILMKYNIEERKLIVNKLLSRITMEVQRTKESDVIKRAVDNLPFGRLMQKAMDTEVK